MPNRRQVLAWGGAAALAAHMRPAGAQALDVAPKLRRGLNLHNLLNWPDSRRGENGVTYTWPPFATATYRMEPWELERVRKLGFDFVRLTVDPAIFLASDDAHRAALNAIVLDRVRMLLAHDLNVIVDMHPVAQNPKFAPAEIAKGAEVFEAYCASAARVARELAGFPHDRVAFEPINEPILDAKDLGQWQTMAERLHQDIRAVAPTLPLVMTGAMWGHLRALLRLDTRPFRGSNLLYTFHYYEPHTFTHQGVDKEESRYISGLKWPPTEAQAEATARAEAAVAADTKLDAGARAKWLQITRKLVADYYGTKPSLKRIDADFDSVSDWAKRNGVANERILLGEFGVTSQGGATPDDRLTWLGTVQDAAERHQFPWALWAYRGYGGMALADDSAQRKLDEPVLRALKMAL